jgi:calpain-15
LLLVKETHDGYEYVEGKNYKDIETHVGRVGVNFTPGKYILYIKIKWHV